jgi:drug/metabolite transporter (DMT)-like permease
MDKIYALLGMLGNTGNDLLYKGSARHRGGRSITLFYLLQAVFIIVFALAGVLLFRPGPLVHMRSIQFALPIGVLTFVIYMLVLKSLVEGEVSTNITVFRLNFVVSSVLAVVLLGEILTVRKVIGLFLCAAAIVALFLSGPRQARRSPTGLRFSIPSCLLASGLNILVKTAFNNGALIVQLILYRYLVVAIIAALFQLPHHGQRERGTGRVYLLALLSAAAMMFALSFTFAALQIGDVALVIPIIQLAFVFSSAGAVLLFKERLSALKILAIALAVGSIIVIA